MANFQGKVKTVIVSGSFDPLHEGHLDLFKTAKIYGRVICILKGDKRLKKKKGVALLPAKTRKKIITPFVDEVVIYDNELKDQSDISLMIKKYSPDFYITSDLTKANEEACLRVGCVIVKMKKRNSSSKILNNYFSKNDYRSLIEKMPIICTDGIIVDRGKYLLVKRRNKPLKGVWWVPGGRVLKGETLQNSFKRKMREEIGVEVDIVGVAGFSEDQYKDNEFNLDYIHTVSVVFIATPKTNKIVLDKQSVDYKWSDTLPKGLIINKI